jgi:hypothetical protein
LFIQVGTPNQTGHFYLPKTGHYNLPMTQPSPSSCLSAAPVIISSVSIGIGTWAQGTPRALKKKPFFVAFVPLWLDFFVSALTERMMNELASSDHGRHRRRWA